MDRLGRNRVFVEDLGQLGCIGHRLDEDDDLVEVKSVNQINQLLNLLVGLQLDVVLLETVERQF